MGEIERVLEKIRKGQVLQVREACAVLKYWGFIKRPGKGSHQNWKHPDKPMILTMAVHDKELPRYISRELRKILEEKDETQIQN